VHVQVGVRMQARCWARAAQGSLLLSKLNPPRSAGVDAAAKGSAWFLLHPNSASMVLGVYGRWGTGKSTFMRLVEREMLYAGARQAVKDLFGTQPEQPDQKLEQQCKDQLEAVAALEHDAGSSGNQDAAEARALLEKIAQPQVVTVWFNAW
jgi:pantothenate kinase-related protein Tda10